MHIFFDRCPDSSARQREEDTRQLHLQWKQLNFPTQELLKLLLKKFGPYAAKIGTDAVVASRYGLNSDSERDE